MKRRYLAVLGLLVIMAMVLSACGGGAPATEAPAAPAEPAATEAPAEAAAPAEPAATEAPAEAAAPATEGVVNLTFISGGP
ncbi:MAG TPA: hypothetical protein PL187_01670, partial [Caldilinea sp.]|nr:hypothetical protein [Caldilinea sp.]